MRTLRAGAQSIGRGEMTRSPKRGPGLDLALGRAKHRILGAHQKGGPVSGKGIRKENIGWDIKRADLGVIDRTSERESDMDYARFRFIAWIKRASMHRSNYHRGSCGSRQKAYARAWVG